MDKELAENIIAVEAITIKGGFFRIEAVMQSGEREVIKAKSTRMPTMVQLYSSRVNGNYQGDGIAQHFTFAKSIDSWEKSSWLKSFVVPVLI